MFIFRNFTVENLFSPNDDFSGYGDISFIPTSQNRLVWCYQTPVNFDSDAKLAEIISFRDKLALVVSQLQPHQTLFICSLVDVFSLDIVDSDTRIPDAVADFNKYARSLASENHNIAFVDLDPFLSRFPKNDWINWRFYFISQMIFAPAVASGFNEWFLNRIEQISGKRKKCLILDLDNTLWGGILGEDGIDGIKIGGDYPGNAFLYFQQALISLAKTGIILAVCSKNNEADVREAWAKNPFIPLNEKHFATYQINWDNKADNIRRIAETLNIGLDSMVFIDDNPTERELVRQQLPMVEVPDFPDKPFKLMDFVKTIIATYFKTPALTDEDRSKTLQYQANAQRAAAARQFTDLNDFIKSLEIKISILPADSFNIPRIAQMTQKTNQFNLTTRRYTDADISSFLKDNHLVICASVADRFGDNGITGAAVIKLDGTSASIDSFLLSCRILGKGIENAILLSILQSLKKRGINSVDASYIPTQKNAQVADFYDRNGFHLSEALPGGTRLYRIDLSNIPPASSLYIINNSI